MSEIAYDVITARIIALLEKGTVPWQMPWDASTSWPRNFVSKKEYSGINVLLLLSMYYKSPYWLTFNQALQLGGSVRKAEKACPVIFWKKLPVINKTTNEEEEIPFLRYYRIFNIAQCDGISENAAANREKQSGMAAKAGAT